jgi:hypothetical protein
LPEILWNPRQIRALEAFSTGRSSQEPYSDGVGAAEGSAKGNLMDCLRRVLLVGIEDPGCRARGLRAEEVSLAQLRAAVAASPQGSVAVLGRKALSAGPLGDLIEALRGPSCITFVCPDGANGMAIARWARESGFEFVAGPSLPSRVAAAARVPMREAVPVAKWAPARACRSSELASALETLARCQPLTAAAWARSLGLSRHQLYRLCKRTSGHSADRLAWMCLKATVVHLESTGHDPTGVHILVGYSSDRSLRRALEREWR